MTARPDVPGEPDRLSKAQASVAFAVVAVGGIILALPRVLAGWPLWRDSIEYAAMGWNLASGQGLVDPISYTNYLRQLHPPIPALAVRPITLSVLLAGPLALGADLGELRVIHVVWASLVGASAVWAARRAMTGVGAVAFAVAVSWSYVWVLASQQFMTEATASGVVLLTIGLYRGYTARHAKALTLAFVVFVGWLSRPNLAVLAAAVPIASVIQLGWRSALRSGPCWTFVLALGVLGGATTVAHLVATGVVPYAHYGSMFDLAEADPFFRFQYEHRSWSAFFLESAPQIASAIFGNVTSLANEFFLGPAYLRVGWFAVPALIHALYLRRSEPERVLAVVAGLLLLASAVVVTYGFSSLRYPLPGSVCLWFVACASLGDVGRALSRRLRAADERWLRLSGGLAATLPLAIALTLSYVDNWRGWLSVSPLHWRSYVRTLAKPKPPAGSAPLRPLCGALDPDAVVASPDPWELYLACGNAGVQIPRDLAAPEWVERYLNEVPLGYFVLDGRAEFDALRRSSRLRPLKSSDGNVLYEVKDPLPESRPWRAPVPLARGGRSERR